jgi:hypothetical protein
MKNTVLPLAAPALVVALAAPPHAQAIQPDNAVTFKDSGIASLTAAFLGTSADEAVYASPANGKSLGRKALVVSVGKTF